MLAPRASRRPSAHPYCATARDHASQVGVTGMRQDARPIPRGTSDVTLHTRAARRRSMVETTETAITTAYTATIGML